MEFMNWRRPSVEVVKDSPLNPIWIKSDNPNSNRFINNLLFNNKCSRTLKIRWLTLSIKARRISMVRQFRGIKVICIKIEGFAIWKRNLTIRHSCCITSKFHTLSKRHSRQTKSIWMYKGQLMVPQQEQPTLLNKICNNNTSLHRVECSRRLKAIVSMLKLPINICSEIRGKTTTGLMGLICPKSWTLSKISNKRSCNKWACLTSNMRAFKTVNNRDRRRVN
jgi:hypothetical protein